MKSSTARKLKQVPVGYLMVGVDPHQKKHAAVALTQDAVVHTKFKFANSRQGYEQALDCTPRGRGRLRPGWRRATL